MKEAAPLRPLPSLIYMVNKELIINLFKQSYSKNKIAQLAGCDRSYVYEVLRKAGLIAPEQKKIHYEPLEDTRTAHQQKIINTLLTQPLPDDQLARIDEVIKSL